MGNSGIILLVLFLCRVNCLQFDGTFTPDVLRGVVDIMSGQHKIGGIYHDEYLTYLDCLQGCRNDDSCLAVDYNADLQACWFHDTRTACTAPIPEKGVKHVQLSSCITGVSVGGGELVARYVTEKECVGSCMRQVHCYGVDYNIKTQRCYHHYMGTACSPKKSNPDTVHYSRVNCKSSPNAVYVSVGHYVAGGIVSENAFTVEDCTTNCIQSANCSAVDYNYNNNTCVIHGMNTVCGPRLPQIGTTHFQYESCQSGAATVTAVFQGQVQYDDGTPVGTQMTLATNRYACINLCYMTTDCGAAEWSEVNSTCLILKTDDACSSTTPTSDFEHFELLDCKMAGEVRDLSEGFHALGGEEKAQFTTRNRCVDSCKQPICQAVDWDDARQACYHHTEVTSCNTRIVKNSCTHYSFVECPEPTRSVLDVRNSSRLPGELTSTMSPNAMTCIEICAGTEDCFAVDYNPDTYKCVLHGQDDSCRASVPVAGWYSYIFADCNQVIPGERNITGAHVPGAKEVRMAISGDACLKLCRQRDECVAADFNSVTSECYLHDADTACGAPITKEGCMHYRLTDCLPKVHFTMPNSRVLGGATKKSAASEVACFRSCVEDPFCIAFDFNPYIPQCRHHDMSTACEDTKYAIGWTHHKLQQCHDLPTTPVTETAYDQYYPGGTMVTKDLKGPAECVDKCLLARVTGSECLAVDFDFTTNECLFHDTIDVCGILEPKFNTSHYKLYDCEANRIPLGDKIYDYPGFRRMMESGSPNAKVLSKEECIEVCHVQALCQGVDFKAMGDGSGMGNCNFHYESTACGVLIPASDVTHISFNDCTKGKGAQVIAEVVYDDLTLPGGEPFPAAQSESECVTSCSGTCFAAAYNKAAETCVHFSLTQACAAQAGSSGTKLYLMTKCGSDLLTTHVTAKYSASKWGGGELNSFAKTHLDCLGVCVDTADCTAFSFDRLENKCYLHSEIECAPVLQGHGCQSFTLYITARAQCAGSSIYFARVYGKFHMAGAELIGQFDQNMCLKMCKADVTCYQVDYNPANKACWVHRSTSCGNTLVRDPRITHFSLKDCPTDDAI